MAARYCHSCMVPLDAPALWGPVAHLCRNCTDGAGKLNAREVVRKEIAGWLKSWQPEVDEAESLRRADLFMRALPAWAADDAAPAATPAKPKAKAAKKAKPKAKAKPAAARRSPSA